MKLFLLGLGIVAALPATGKWLLLRSPHFELYTDAGETTGRQTLARFEQIHNVFQDIAGNSARSPLPVRVFIFDSESDFHHYRPAKSTTGFYQGGPERDYIVMRVAGPETFRVVFHEYVHLVLNHSSARLPQWLEEGTAEFYSTLEESENRLLIGKPVLIHLRTLMRNRWLDAEALEIVSHDSPAYNEADKVGVFYAESWALVHMLNLAPGYRQRLPRFAELLAEGRPHAPAFEQAFGKPMQAALHDLEAYVGKRRFPVVEIKRDPAEAVQVNAQPLSSTEALLAQVDLALQLGRADHAAKMLKTLSTEQPDSPAVQTALGMLEMSRSRFTAARAHLERAIALGSRQAASYFEYAMLLRETGGGRDRIVENLKKTVELNPNFAEAHFLLGVMADTDGRPRDAIEPLRHAVSILPRQAYFWHALALAYHHIGEPEQAQRAASRALEAAVTAQETEMARAALRLTTTAPARQPPQRPGVTTPETWRNKQGDSRVGGVLQRIDCLGLAARLHVLAGGKRVALYVANPGQVLLKNLSSLTFEFACGEQEPQPVVIEYISNPDRKLGTVGEVTAIEFR